MVHAHNPSPEHSEAGRQVSLCDFETSLIYTVYVVSSRPARDTLSQKKN